MNQGSQYFTEVRHFGQLLQLPQNFVAVEILSDTITGAVLDDQH